MRVYGTNVRLMHVALILLLACAAWGGVASMANGSSLPADTAPVSLQPGQKVFPYYNPVYPADAPDPAVLRAGDYFYTAVTGQRIMRSGDMIHWENVGTFFGGTYPAWVDGAAPQFIWAPDLQYIDGRYLLYFSAKQKTSTGHYMGIGVAWSDKPEGPYTGNDTPLASGPGYANIDPHVFRDDDGTLYVYWGSDHQPILAQQLTPDGLSTAGAPRVVLRPAPHLRYSRLVEAPWVIKRGAYYYLFWSGSGYFPGQYAVSVGRSLSPLGPFEHYRDNPIVEGDLLWASPGHNALIQDDAGQDWLFYHAYDWTDTDIGRMLLIDPLVWQDGWPHIDGRVPSRQPVAAGPIWTTPAIPVVEVALGKGVSASSTADGHSAEAVTDGNSFTGWLPEHDDEQPWITVDLGELRRVTTVDLRFGKVGDRRYLIETSQDGITWQLFADRRDGSVYPFTETGEATARYVRVNMPEPLIGDDDMMRLLRVYAYDGVWLSAPDGGDVITGALKVAVSAVPDFNAEHVQLKLNDKTLYDGNGLPAELISAGFVADGRHALTLTVTDTNEAIWRHTVPVNVQQAVINGVSRGTVFQGDMYLNFASGLQQQHVEIARVSFVPVRMGETLDDEAVVVYAEEAIPGTLLVDTTALADGSYDLIFHLQAADGLVSTATERVIVRNWDQLLDVFEPPAAVGWFGTVDKKKTVSETPGWHYAVDDAASFFDDGHRRIWQGTGTGHLVWELPALQRFVVTVYVRGADAVPLVTHVSPDGDEWTPVAWEQKTVNESVSGWAEVRLDGVVADPMTARYLRLSLDAGPDRVQLGEVKLVYPALREPDRGE